MTKSSPPHLLSCTENDGTKRSYKCTFFSKSFTLQMKDENHCDAALKGWLDFNN